MTTNPLSAVKSAVTLPEEAVIVGRGLTKAYGARQVLAGIDLTVATGEVVGLLGENGAGKSTCLRCLLGLSLLDQGSAQVFGTDAARLGAMEKRRIGYVPQLSTLQSWMPVRELLAYVGAFYPTWDAIRVEDLRRSWTLPLSARVGDLSPGEKQRLSLLLALGHRPPLLILDEPVSSLDPSARREAMAALLEATVEDGATILISTHMTSDIERIASRVVMLHRGRISLDGDLDEIKDAVKRLHVIGLTAADLRRVPGQLRCVQRADGLVLTVRGDVAQTLAQLRAMPSVGVTVEDLNLEEIFLELNQ